MMSGVRKFMAKGFILFVGGLLFTSAASAEIRQHKAQVKYVQLQADGSVVIVFAVSDQYCLGSDDPKRYHVTVGQNGMTMEGLRNIYAAALAALAAEKTLAISFDDANAACYINSAGVEA